ncbi:MAG: hypothetical protein LBT79_07725, partial [Elusimicrobiota bacterium]|nr:hypothetical protein [Elusimicrobiota bacterium]
LYPIANRAPEPIFEKTIPEKTEYNQTSDRKLKPFIITAIILFAIIIIFHIFFRLDIKNNSEVFAIRIYKNVILK